mgnify:CR=1 FL=1
MQRDGLKQWIVRGRSTEPAHLRFFPCHPEMPVAASVWFGWKWLPGNPGVADRAMLAFGAILSYRYIAKERYDRQVSNPFFVCIGPGLACENSLQFVCTTKFYEYA